MRTNKKKKTELPTHSCYSRDGRYDTTLYSRIIYIKKYQNQQCTILYNKYNNIHRKCNP